MALCQTLGLTDLNEAVKVINEEEIDAFLSTIILAQTNTIFLDSNMYMMVQTLEEEDGPCLPHGLNGKNVYTEMTTGSEWVSVMVKNLTATLITIAKDVKVTWVVATNVVPQVEVVLGTLEKLEEMQGVQQTRMSVEQRKERIFQQQDFSGLEEWSVKNCSCPTG